MALNRFLRPRGANSAMMAPPVATIMPTPTPVRKRKNPKVSVDVVSAVRAMPAENQTDATSMTRLRPNLSPTAPAVSAPTRTPMSAHAPSVPAVSGVRAPIWEGSASRVGRTAP